MLSQQGNMKIVGCKIPHNPKLTIVNAPLFSLQISCIFSLTKQRKTQKFQQYSIETQTASFLKNFFLVWDALGANMRI
jgi:hypothetical protein